jgi:hypothetical protein
MGSGSGLPWGSAQRGAEIFLASEVGEGKMEGRREGEKKKHGGRKVAAKQTFEAGGIDRQRDEAMSKSTLNAMGR